MTDRPNEPAAETPMQRALRLKKAAREAKPGAPGAQTFKREQTAAMPAGASKPWMKKG